MFPSAASLHCGYCELGVPSKALVSGGLGIHRSALCGTGTRRTRVPFSHFVPQILVATVGISTFHPTSNPRTPRRVRWPQHLQLYRTGLQATCWGLESSLSMSRWRDLGKWPDNGAPCWLGFLIPVLMVAVSWNILKQWMSNVQWCPALIVCSVRLVIDFQFTQICLPKWYFITYILAFWPDASHNVSGSDLCAAPTFEEIGASVFDFTDLQATSSMVSAGTSPRDVFRLKRWTVTISHNFFFQCIYLRIITHAHTHIYTYIYIYTYTYIHIYTHIYIHIYTYIHIYIYTYLHIFTYVYICLHIYIYLWIPIPIYIIHMHIIYIQSFICTHIYK